MLYYYPFDGNADDAGDGNDGTVVGAVLDADRDGDPSSAYRFDGVADRLALADGGCAFAYPSGSFTLAAWVNADSYDSGTTLYENTMLDINNAKSGIPAQNSGIELRFRTRPGSMCPWPPTHSGAWHRLHGGVTH